MMLLGGKGWEKASRAGRTIADYFYDRFDNVAGDEAVSYRPTTWATLHTPHGAGPGSRSCLALSN